MNVFPPEIWHLICPFLEQNDLCSLRLVDKAAASIGAEYLISSIRIDTSLDSLQKLRDIADHPSLGKGVREVIYEGSHLADVCIHFHQDHYTNNNHADLPAPVKPAGEDATPRAKRVYKRDKKRFDADVQARYAKYRAIFDEQQRIRDEAEKTLKSCLAKLKLKQVTLKTGSLYANNLSQRFIEKFCTDCAIPLDPDPDHTTWQFRSVLVPGLTTFAAREVSLKAFSEEENGSKDLLIERFKGLKSLSLELKQGRLDRDTPQAFSLPNSWLPCAVEASSKSLEVLMLHFELLHADEHAGKIEDLIITTIPNLRQLNVNFLTTTEESLTSMLKGMPELKTLILAFIQLSGGSWLTTVRRFRDELDLANFFVNGLLEDAQETTVVDFCDREMWRDGERYSISDALDLYVTDKEFSTPENFESEEDFEICCNPFHRLEDFADEEDLIFELGDIDSSDFDDDDYFDIHDDEEKSDDDMQDAFEDAVSSMDVD